MATIFYSWQNDISKMVNKNFIKDALEKAIEEITEFLNLDETPLVDQDTYNVPGSPEVFSTVLKKIENCAIFVADITIVAHTTQDKAIPNPNVLIEYGYALKTVGADHIICIMNEFFGYAENSLPFDLKHRRWPIRYNLGEESYVKEKINQKEQLIQQIKDAITTIIKAGLLERKPENIIKLNSSTRLVPALSREAQILLKEASIDKQGIIMHLESHDGTAIQTNGKNFVENDTPREAAKWKAALSELVVNELVQDAGYKGEVFELTKSGYEIADAIVL
jgi:hypothetical protein